MFRIENDQVLNDLKLKPREGLRYSLEELEPNINRIIIRAQQVEKLSFPPYEQNHWADSQHCNERRWVDLVDLWYAYNSHLAHVMTKIPDGKLSVPCVIEEEHPVTLEFLVTDYVDHLRHHLAQVGVV